MFIWVLVMLTVFTSSLCLSSQFTSLPALLRRGMFMAISAFTTTGLQNVTTNQMGVVFSSGAFLTLGIFMAVGGGAGSTAGGIKFSRVGLILKSIIATMKQVLAPDSARTVVTYNHLGRQILNEGAVKEAMTVFMLFVVTYISGALVGVAYGYDATQAIFESIAMTSNGGLSTIVGPGMPAGLELFYMFQMWAGRLEFVTLLALMVQIVLSFVPRNLRKAITARNAGSSDYATRLDLEGVTAGIPDKVEPVGLDGKTSELDRAIETGHTGGFLSGLFVAKAAEEEEPVGAHAVAVSEVSAAVAAPSIIVPEVVPVAPATAVPVPTIEAVPVPAAYVAPAEPAPAAYSADVEPAPAYSAAAEPAAVAAYAAAASAEPVAFAAEPAAVGAYAAVASAEPVAFAADPAVAAPLPVLAPLPAATPVPAPAVSAPLPPFSEVDDHE